MDASQIMWQSDSPRGKTLRVAVLAGGDSAEREVSLESGRQVVGALTEAGYRVTQVDPSETSLDCLQERFDLCFLALHGGDGENGQIQATLENRKIPYTGSPPVASARAMRKSIAKACFRKDGVRTPDWSLVESRDSDEKILEKAHSIGFPLVVKPDDQGSSLGVGIAETPESLFQRIAAARRFGGPILLERWIAGREWTVSVMGRRALAPLEIVGAGPVFDFDAKYRPGQIEYHFGADQLPIEKERLQQIAIAAAKSLQTRGVVRVDLIADEEFQASVLEVNTLPE